MPSVVRLGDQCTGHHSFGPRPNDSASGDVFANGIGVHRVGDHWIVHCSGGCHDGIQATGAPTVYVNNKPLARVGDQISCGSFNAQGSPNVFAGDSSGVKPGFSGQSFSERFGDTSDLEPTY